MTPNAQLIAAVVAFIGLLATIIAGAWLNQRGLERQMDAFRNELKAEFAAVRVEIGAVRLQIAAIENRLDKIERQLEAIFKPVLPQS